MGFTLTQLQHFVAIAEEGTMSRAAERCNIAQPSLSTSLRNLEAQVGKMLFAREPRGLRLTAEGERFLRHARHILTLAHEAVDDMKTEPDETAGTVRIAVAATLSGFLVPALLQEAARHLPRATLEIEELERREAEAGIVSGKIDLAITIVSHLSRRERIAYEVLLRSPRQIWTCVDHELLAKEAVSLADLAAYDFVLLETDEHAALVKQYWADHGFAPKIVFRSLSVECIRNLVGQGSGITILSDFIYRGWSHDGGRIRRRPLTIPPPTLDIGIGHRDVPELSPAARRVLEMVRRLTAPVNAA
jgi:DNA-binding transcriptional LysR family regulator